MKARRPLAALAALAAVAIGCSSKPADKPGAEPASAPGASAPAPASSGWPNPREACAYLDGRGYENHGYKAYDPRAPTELTCQSLNRKVGGGRAVVGEAGFYYSVLGGPERADHMRLRVDVVRGGADEQKALDEFAATAAELSQRAFRVGLHDEAAAALRAGTAGKWTLEGGHELKLERLKGSGGPFGQVYQLIAELR